MRSLKEKIIILKRLKRKSGKNRSKTKDLIKQPRNMIEENKSLIIKF